MPVWKRILLITATSVITLCAAGGLTIYVFYWYDNHSRPLRTWPDVAITTNGIKLSIETKWRDGSLSYRVLVSPLPPRTTQDFDAAVKSDRPELTFNFEDSDRIKLCSISIPSQQFIRITDDHKITTSLEAADTTYSCELSSYKDAAFMEVNWTKLPNVAALAAVQPAPVQPAPAPGATDDLRSRIREAIRKRAAADTEQNVTPLGLYGSIISCIPYSNGAFLYDNALLSGSPITLIKQGEVLKVWPSGQDNSYAAQVFDYQTEKTLRSGFIAADCLAKTWPTDIGINGSLP